MNCEGKKDEVENWIVGYNVWWLNIKSYNLVEPNVSQLLRADELSDG